jgi:hypothetical protein
VRDSTTTVAAVWLWGDTGGSSWFLRAAYSRMLGQGPFRVAEWVTRDPYAGPPHPDVVVQAPNHIAQRTFTYSLRARFCGSDAEIEHVDIDSVQEARKRGQPQELLAAGFAVVEVPLHLEPVVEAERTEDVGADRDHLRTRHDPITVVPVVVAVSAIPSQLRSTPRPPTRFNLPSAAGVSFRRRRA